MNHVTNNRPDGAPGGGQATLPNLQITYVPCWFLAQVLPKV